jgi:hypothetical protein
MQQLCLFQTCGKCLRCSDSALQEKAHREKSEALKIEMNERIKTALGKFYDRVRDGRYVSPEQKRESQKRPRF